MKELLDAASQVGFPIVISFLLLVRIENKMNELALKINELNETIIKLTTIIEERLKKK